MVDCAQGKDTPPIELQIAFMSGGELPDKGALLDQEFKLITRMNEYLGIYRTIQKVKSLTGEKINTALTPSERVLLSRLAEMGVLWQR